MSNVPSTNGNNGRDAGGRFAKGNHHGVATRYVQGRCGNPKGRPPTFETYLDQFNSRGYGLPDLYRLLADPASRRNERDAAKWSILWFTSADPIRGADPVRAKKYYRRWYGKTYDRLFDIYVNKSESLERREAARRRLFKRWIAPVQQQSATR